MKSIKILGIAVATLGVAASIGGAIALYKKPANDTGFGIGAGTHTGSTSTVTYKINNAVDPTVNPDYWNGSAARDDNGGLDSTYKEIKYTFGLSAVYANDLVSQAYVLGNLSISLTNIPEAQRGHLSIWASVENYAENSLGEYYYKNAFMDSDFAITAEHTEYVANRDVCVTTSGGQELVIYLKYDSTYYNADLLNADEGGLGYTLSVTWGAVSNSFGKAYVVGTGTLWAQDDEFLMAPNIAKAHSEGWEWVYNGLVGSSSWTLAKCNKTENDVTTYSSGENAELTNGTTYNVYWNGDGSTAASFAAQGA